MSTKGVVLEVIIILGIQMHAGYCASFQIVALMCFKGHGDDA